MIEPETTIKPATMIDNRKKIETPASTHPSRVDSCLLRHGGGTLCTNRYEAVPDAIAAEIRRQAVLEEGERPLAVSYRDRERWCLLTTERLIWRFRRMRGGSRWRELVAADIRARDRDALRCGTLQPTELELLVVTDRFGTSFAVSPETGPAFLLLWDLVRALIA
jgi:hypothetical protein